jgi:hypothetical protein
MIKLMNVNNESQKSKIIRKTHCFNCKEEINSQQWEDCKICKGIVCSCGSCFCSWERSSYDF